MAKGAWSTIAYAVLYLAQIATGSTTTTAPKTLAPKETPTSTNIACGWASSASSQFVADQPEATQVLISADLAYNCLKSVPNYQEPALRLLNSLRTYLEFQSTKEYLKRPPPGYLFPAVDLDTEFNNIQKKVENGEYESEYDMQVAITSLLTSARDGHLSWNGDLMGAFTFVRSVGSGLAAVSSDGEQPPQVYLVGKCSSPMCCNS